MDKRFNILFKIECVHKYFADPLESGLRVNPTSECRRLLAGYDLLFREMPGGGAVYYGERSDLAIIRTIKEIISFTFTLTSTDPNFINYTDLALREGALSPYNSVFYFNNLTENIDDKERNLLHARNAVSVEDQLLVKRSAFRYTFETPVTDAHLQVVDGLLGKEVWDARTGPEKIGFYDIDLRGQPPGRYRLQVDGQGALTFYLTDTVPSRHWGLVEIFVADTASAMPIPKPYRMINEVGKITEKTFSLYFENRKTYWKYYIIVSQYSEKRRFEGYEVVGKDKKEAKDILFTKLKDEEINGKQAMVFQSVETISLWYLPAEKHGFEFKPGAGASGSDMTLKLPYAGSTMIKPDTNEPDKIFSEMYVVL